MLNTLKECRSCSFLSHVNFLVKVMLLKLYHDLPLVIRNFTRGLDFCFGKSGVTGLIVLVVRSRHV